MVNSLLWIPPMIWGSDSVMWTNQMTGNPVLKQVVLSSIIWSSTILSHTQLGFSKKKYALFHTIVVEFGRTTVSLLTFFFCHVINQDTTFNQPNQLSSIYFHRLFQVSHQQHIHLLWCNVPPSKLHDHTWEPLLKKQGENANSKHRYFPEVSHSPSKMMAGRLLSFWDGKYSGCIQGLCYF